MWESGWIRGLLLTLDTISNTTQCYLVGMLDTEYLSGEDITWQQCKPRYTVYIDALNKVETFDVKVLYKIFFCLRQLFMTKILVMQLALLT